MSYCHEVRVRYVDCDMQGVVYNAHYLTFIDDAFDCWLREIDMNFEEKFGSEVMLKQASIVWESPVKFSETLDIECKIIRWGNTSFDGFFVGSVNSRKTFEATVTYVCVDHVNYGPIKIPTFLKEHLERKA